MKTLKPLELRKAFERKSSKNDDKELAFECTEGKHLKWELQHLGKIVTHVCIPLSRSELGPRYLEGMRQKMRLSREEFEMFVECPLTLGGWANILEKKGLLL